VGGDATGGAGAGAAAGGAGAGAAAGGAGAGAAAGGVEAGSDGRTPAERVYDEAQAKRQRAVAQKMAAKSYREKVADLNAALVKAPEHNDLFRISYGQS
jgi:hypothetical protein